MKVVVCQHIRGYIFVCGEQISSNFSAYEGQKNSNQQGEKENKKCKYVLEWAQ